MTAELKVSKAWPKVSLGDVATEYSVRVDNPEKSDFQRFVGSNHIGRFELTVSDWGSTSEVTSAMKLFQPGDYLLVRRSLYASDFRERAARADFEGVCSGDILTIREKEGAVAPGFLSVVLNSAAIWAYIVAQATGSITRRIKWRQLREFEFALPPVEEQRRVTKALLAANSALGELKSAHEDSLVLRDALIIEHIEHGLTKCAKSEYRIGAFPSHWTICPLGERYELQFGKMMSPEARNGPRQIHYLRNANIQWNELDLSDVGYMSFSESEEEKFALKYGDILACEGRHVGKSALWRDEIPGACYQKSLHRLRPLSDQDHPEYLLHCLRYYSITGRFVAETGETTIPHLPAVRFRAMHFPFPPRDEQQKIAEAIGRFDLSCQSIKTRRKQAKSLLSTLAQQVWRD